VAQVLAVALVVVSALGVVAFLGHQLWGRDASDNLQFTPPDKPAEYLYLDVARVLTYLPQLVGGLPADQREEISRTQGIGIDLKATSGAGGSGSVEEKRTLARSLTETAGSRFYQLLDRLTKRKDFHEYYAQARDADRLKEAKPLDANSLNHVREGDFVRISGLELVMPSYASDYDIYKTRTDIVAASSSRSYTRKQRRQLATFLNAAGKRPRLCFVATVGSGDEKLSLLLPAQYALLGAQSELLTGEQTVVGKVIRTLVPNEGSGEEGFSRERYTDIATVASFRPAVRALPGFVLDLHSRAALDSLQQTRKRLGLSKNDPSYRDRLAEYERNALRSRRTLRQALARQTTITAPGLVILPIAIYK
jgi:hypothetical protein